MTPNPRILSISGVKNFRDLGGYEAAEGRKIKANQLYRSGHLTELTDDGTAAINHLGITNVVDFRSDAEKERNPVKWAKAWSPEYYATPIGGNAAAWVNELYQRVSASAFPATELHNKFILAFQTIPIANVGGLRQFMDVLVDSDTGGSILFHCTAGKDRTGIAGALVMKALGVPDDQIMEDFLLTNDAVDLAHSSEKVASWLSDKTGRTVDPADVHPLVGVEEAFLHAAYQSIETEYGSIEKYLQSGLGLTPSRKRRLEVKFLET